jgi:hypothetical protein
VRSETWGRLFGGLLVIPTTTPTDAASPAWWRGHDHTTKVFCALVNDILDGKDDGSGVNREPWASTRKRLLGLRAEKSKWKRRAKLFHEAYKEKDFESFALGLQKMQLEASGADVILPWQNRSLRARLLDGCKERNRLRAALAQVGEKVKAKAVSEILRRQTDDAKPPFRCTPYFDVLRQIANAVNGIDLAAIVAASAETTGEPAKSLHCSTCGGSTPTMRKDSRNQIACDRCFQKWEFTTRSIGASGKSWRPQPRDRRAVMVKTWLDSFLQGAASVLDIGGTLAPTLDDILLRDFLGTLTDAEAIRSDWESVLGDWQATEKGKVGDGKYGGNDNVWIQS